MPVGSRIPSLTDIFSFWDVELFGPRSLAAKTIYNVQDTCHSSTPDALIQLILFVSSAVQARETVLACIAPHCHVQARHYYSSSYHKPLFPSQLRL